MAVIDTTPGKGFPILYFSYAGGTGTDIPLAMALDSSSNIYLTGTTNSTNFPTAGSAIQTAGAGSNIVSGFVLELNPGLSSGTSSLVYSTYLGGTTGNQSANGIALDAGGNIYVIGTTKATDFPVIVHRLSVHAERIAGRLSVQDHVRPPAPWPMPRIWAANWKTMAAALP